MYAIRSYYVSPFGHLSALSLFFLGFDAIFENISFVDLAKISITSTIDIPNLISGLSEPYFSIASLYVILGKVVGTSFPQALNVSWINFSATLIV